MVRTNQGGSILGFVIIGAVMAALLVGGAYIVRHNLSSISEDVPVAVEDTSDNEGATDTGEDNSSQSDENKNTDQSDSKPSTDSTDSEKPTSDEVAQNESAGSDSSSQDTLPQTGMGDAVVAGLLLGSIVGATTAYVRSRS